MSAEQMETMAKQAEMMNRLMKLRSKELELKDNNFDIYIEIAKKLGVSKYEYEISGENQEYANKRQVFLVLRNKDKDNEEREKEINIPNEKNFFNEIEITESNKDVEFKFYFWEDKLSINVDKYTNSEFFIRAKYNEIQINSNPIELKKIANKVNITNLTSNITKDDSQDEMVKLSQHPEYRSLFKLMKMTNNKEAAKQRAIINRLEPNILELDGNIMVPSGTLVYDAIKDNKVQGDSSISDDSQKSVDYESLDLNELVNNLGKIKKLKLFNMLNIDNSTSSSSIDHRNSNLNFKLNDNFLNLIIR